MQDIKYTISFFNGNRDRFPKREDLSFKQLKDRLNKAAYKNFTSKNELEAMVCGEFIRNERIAVNLYSRSIITYDIDKYKGNLEKLIGNCELCLKDNKYVYYTTVSSSFENPRIRILVFPNVIISPTALYGDICRRLAEDIFSIDILEALDKSSYSPMQLMYLPCKKDGYFRGKANDGKLVDISKYFAEKSVVKNNSFLIDYKNLPLANCDDKKVWNVLDQYDVEETSYHEWFAVCQALHHQYLGGDKGLEIFTKWSLLDSREEKEYIEQHALRKYKSVRSECENPITFASIIKIVNNKKKLPIDVVSKSFELIATSKFVDFKYNRKDQIIGIKTTYRNFEAMCEHYGIKISYDIITKENVNSLNVNNQNSLLSIIQSAMILNNMDRGMALSFINFMAENNKINSFKNILDNVVWDGVDRLNEFYNTITVEESLIELRNLYLLKWLQQMLYLTLHEGDRKIARNILVLQSKQYCGKSTWLKALLPPHLSDYIGEGLHLNTNDSMSILSCIKKIFVELGELEQSFKKTDINQFKAFFGRTKDELNIKYLACPMSYTRTTSFLGTINEVSFLKDKTGSTRFLVLPVQKLDGFHNIDMLQLYKQIIKIGYINFELNEEEREQQKLLNEEFEQPDLIDEQFIEVFETEFEDIGVYYNCTQILEQIGYSKKDINHSRRCDIANVLRKYDFKYRKKDKKWYVKLKKGDKDGC